MVGRDTDSELARASRRVYARPSSPSNSPKFPNLSPQPAPPAQATTDRLPLTYGRSLAAPSPHAGRTLPSIPSRRRTGNQQPRPGRRHKRQAHGTEAVAVLSVPGER